MKDDLLDRFMERLSGKLDELFPKKNWNVEKPLGSERSRALVLFAFAFMYFRDVMRGLEADEYPIKQKRADVDIAFDDCDVDLAKMNIKVKRINNSISREKWNKTKRK